MSDTSQDVTDAPIAERLARLIEGLLNEWPAERPTAMVRLEMTFDQWSELLATLSSGEGSANGAVVEQIFDPTS